MNRGYDRTDRVARQVHEILAGLLLREVKDPRVSDVELTDVQVSGDLGVADVYYVVMDPDDARPDEETRAGLEKVVGFLRARLGEQIDLRRVPELRFHYDQTLEDARRIEELLAAERNGNGADDGADED